MSRSPARRSAQVWRGADGRKFGRTLPMITTVIMSMAAAMQARNDAGDEQLADILLGDDAVDR